MESFKNTEEDHNCPNNDYKKGNHSFEKTKRKNINRIQLKPKI